MQYAEVHRARRRPASRSLRRSAAARRRRSPRGGARPAMAWLESIARNAVGVSRRATRSARPDRPPHIHQPVRAGDHHRAAAAPARPAPDYSEELDARHLVAGQTRAIRMPAVRQAPVSAFGSVKRTWGCLYTPRGAQDRPPRRLVTAAPSAGSAISAASSSCRLPMTLDVFRPWSGHRGRGTASTPGAVAPQPGLGEPAQHHRARPPHRWLCQEPGEANEASICKRLQLLGRKGRILGHGRLLVKTPR